MGVLDDNTAVPSFMRNPGWAELQREIAAGLQAGRSEAQARLVEIKARIAAAEIEEGFSVLGSVAPKEDLYVLRRKHNRHPSLEWLIEKPLTGGEVDQLIALRSKLGEQPMLDRAAFISLAEAKEAEAKRQEGQIQTIRRLMKASKISFSLTTELPETSSLGEKLDGEGTTFVLGGGFFGENPGYRQYFYGMLFNDAEKTKLVWLFDEVRPESFVSVTKLKESLARKFGHGNGHEPHGTIGERLPGVEDALLQGHPDRHTVGPAPRRAAKPRRRPEAKPNDGDDEDFVTTGGRASGRKKK